MERNFRPIRWIAGLAVVGVLAIALSACSSTTTPTQSSGSGSAATPAARTTSQPAANTTSEPAASPTQEAMAATQEPAKPSSEAGTTDAEVIASDQNLGLGDTLTVASVKALEKGWIAIQTDDNGKPGAIIGYIAVPKDASQNVVVHIDKSKATHKVYAVLYVDAGKDGVFEAPNPDTQALNASNEDVMAAFNITNVPG